MRSLEAAIRDIEGSAHTAFAEQDSWALLTASGMDSSALQEASATSQWLAKRLELSCNATIFDLGAGIGRHLAQFQRLGFSVAGIDASTHLVRLANRVLGAATVTRGDFRAIPHRLDASVCLLMADTVALPGSLNADRAMLRGLRQAIPDHCTLVAEISRPEVVPTGVIEWREVGGVKIRERVALTDAGNGHPRFEREFVFNRDGAAYRYAPISVAYTADLLAALLADSGFKVEDAIGFSAGREVEPGRSETIIVVSHAARGYNYLANLPTFLEAWSDPSHPANRCKVELVETSNGRLTRSLDAPVGEGDALTRHHPGFLRCLEPRVRPLVEELVFGWNEVSYSSCEGHEHKSAGRGVISDAYIGLVALSDEHGDALRTLLGKAIEDRSGWNIRQRDLYGPVGKVAAVDLVLPRENGRSWKDYEAGVARSVLDLAQSLRLIRQSLVSGSSS